MAEMEEIPNMTGLWKVKRNDENFDKYLQAVGLNFFLRKMIANTSLSNDITQDGNNFNIKIITSMATQEQKFTVGEPYDFYNSFRKVTLNRIAKWEGNSLVITSTKDDNEPVERRELDGDMLVLTMTKGDVSTKRYFEKQVKK